MRKHLFCSSYFQNASLPCHSAWISSVTTGPNPLFDCKAKNEWLRRAWRYVWSILIIWSVVHDCNWILCSYLLRMVLQRPEKDSSLHSFLIKRLRGRWRSAPELTSPNWQRRRKRQRLRRSLPWVKLRASIEYSGAGQMETEAGPAAPWGKRATQ